MDVGLHLNLNQEFSAGNCPAQLRQGQASLRRFLDRSKYAQLVYNPFLRKAFHDVYRLQAEEFLRLYGRPPSHVDGHRHLHLCSNVVLDGIIPEGQKVRRSFSFWPGEKSLVNRTYRSFVDKRLARRHRTTGYFFALSQCLRHQRMDRVGDLARSASVELMTHPEKTEEYGWLVSDECLAFTNRLEMCSYSAL
jgi:predicted glycoside hydrolase/deacetylase ChbG (UPF0249 family)